ncbi:MAG TPA: hypothetical protein H9825_08915 [Candidatus Sphingobacterium stercorigallinarum]|nr:hypothetical protein [Candidatus Sphingobacterium stercorigallinarum]
MPDSIEKFFADLADVIVLVCVALFLYLCQAEHSRIVDLLFEIDQRNVKRSLLMCDALVCSDKYL